MVTITRLNEDRWQECRDLRLEALQKEPLAYSSSFEEEQTRPEAFWRNSTKNFLFATVDNQPIGMAGIFRYNYIKTNHVVEIFGVYVKKEHRGHGIGKQLVEATLGEIYTLKDVMKIKIAVNPTQKVAERLYLKLGFETTGRLKKEMRVNGNFYDELLMEKHV